MNEKTFEDAKAVLSKDPIMAELLQTIKMSKYDLRGDYFVSLCRSIIGQQLSVKASHSIYKKVVDGIGEPTPDLILRTDEETLRAFGLSYRKISYLKSLADHYIENKGQYDSINELSDSEVIEFLTQIKGIGKWTAEMFSMFTLGRLDIFAFDDLGLRRAMEALYGVKKDSDPSVYEKIAEQWAPYRSIASLYLWRSLDNEPY